MLALFAATLLAFPLKQSAWATDPTPPLPSSSPAVSVNAPATVPSTAVDAPVKPEPARKSQNVTINLINRLVERGVLSKEDAAELIKQAEEDAVEARAQTNAIAAIQSVNPPPPITDENGASLAPVAVADLSAEAEDTVRVTYIPETVKAQLREEIKQEVLDQARDERWAAPAQFSGMGLARPAFRRPAGALRGRLLSERQ